MIRSIHLLLAFLALFAGNANLFAAAGRPLSITDAAGRTMSFSYGSLGHLTQLVSADGQITRYQYDNAGNISRRCHKPAIGTEHRVSYRFSLEPRTKSSRFFGVPARAKLAGLAKALKLLRIRA